LNPAKDAARLSLVPEEFFVLSRMDGEHTVDEIVGLCGLDHATTMKALEHLLEVGALQRVGKPKPERKRGGSDGRDRAQERRRKLLKSQLSAGPREGAPARERRPKREEEAPQEVQEPEEEPEPVDAGPVVLPVPEDDRRLDRTCGLPVDEQRQLLALKDRLGTLTHFEILGMRPTADVRALRVAYRLASRRFHPDAHYGRDVGAYRDLLDELFRRAKEAREILLDDDTRVAYVEKLLEPERRKKRAADEAAALARAYAEEQARQEREKEEARRAKAEEVRREARKKRDAERARKQRKVFAAHVPKSALAARTDKARKHSEEGIRLMEAGSFAAAANLFRLAKELAPKEPEYHELWQRCFMEARRERAGKAVAKAQRAMEAGEDADAAQLFVAAAEANPTAENLSLAADAIRDSDPPKARQLALRCLDVVNAAAAMGTPLSRADAGGIHVRLGRVFLAAGQMSSAEHHAESAKRYLPEDPEVLALLNSIKVT
jgi:curved DNA-binding protein CbpA